MEAIACLKSMTLETVIMIGNEILGKWKVVKSEIPNYQVDDEILEFRPDGVFVWILDGHVLTYLYEIVGGSLTYKVGSNSVEVKISRDSDLLILEPNHKHRSWIARLKNSPEELRQPS